MGPIVTAFLRDRDFVVNDPDAAEALHSLVLETVEESLEEQAQETVADTANPHLASQINFTGNETAEDVTEAADS